MTALRDRIEAVLTIYGETTPVQLDFWEAALEPHDVCVDAAFTLWIRSQERSPKPIDIIRLVSIETLSQSMLLILSEVAGEYGLSTDALRGTGKHGTVNQARQDAMFRMYEAGFSYPRIGGFLNRDPSTIMHGVNMHRSRLADVQEVS